MSLPSYTDLVAKAQDLGFEKVGLLRVEDIGIREDSLMAWLSSGYHGEMGWMQTHAEKRIDPASLMPGTQSILCVAMNYYPGEIPEDQTAKVARYAQGDDYHDVLKLRLRDLLNWLKTFDSELEGRPLVDSAPIMEKALAVQAGLGWQGKNSNLVTRDLGSWVFLGELLLNKTFQDAPVPEVLEDFCGRCRRCIDACPTDAIVEDRVVDATRCISYWTIEYMGDSFPDAIENNLEGWLFGCDICQDVCPWNLKFQQPTQEPAFLPRPWNARPHLSDIEQLTPEQFRVRYRKNPVKRTKLSGLQRNAAALTRSIRRQKSYLAEPL